MRKDFSSDLYGDIYNGEHFLASDHTLQWLREEFYFPSEVISRENYQVWHSTNGKSASERAHEKVKELLTKEPSNLLQPAIVQELENIMLADARKYGVEKLP